MQMIVVQGDSQKAAAVVVLAGKGMLEMDLGQALAEAGLSMTEAFPPHRSLAPALIVDSEVMDRRISALVRRHAKAGVPVVMITDDEAAARKITGPNTLFFRKPLVSDVVVAAVKRLLAEA